ncbi:MAG: hypothetical protein Ct9H300mP13_6330 [Gammaproteobacteria bacterium]|nr:MAG: hypothetical protein Ct9H300mP13_6330 [Gammaproteobacteria bacterium]
MGRGAICGKGPRRLLFSKAASIWSQDECFSARPHCRRRGRCKSGRCFSAPASGFLLTYADLLSDLELPHSRAGDPISLIERQVDVLRQKNASQQVQLEQLVFHAKENELRQQRLMRFFISLSALTEPKGFLCENMPKQLAETFDLAMSISSLLLSGFPKLKGWQCSSAATRVTPG